MLKREQAARSLGLDGLAGCLRPGSFADCLILDLEAPEAIPYYFGVNRVIQRAVNAVLDQIDLTQVVLDRVDFEVREGETVAAGAILATIGLRRHDYRNRSFGPRQ